MEEWIDKGRLALQDLDKYTNLKETKKINVFKMSVEIKELKNHNEKISLNWNQIEHWKIKNMAIEIKKTELGLNNRLDPIKANLTEIQNRRHYAEISHQWILLLCIVCPCFMSHSYKHLVYIIKQNKDFDPSRVYILEDKTEIKNGENTKQI